MLLVEAERSPKAGELNVLFPLLVDERADMDDVGDMDTNDALDPMERWRFDADFIILVPKKLMMMMGA